ncbi:hypothetical protein V5799_004734 [Amblyomma americanum]|uniref:Uncharacterized protein n=1 Tax=Amblyomma americanum TaxID=6943 RepID=A0AAQ4D593_AMBAM
MRCKRMLHRCGGQKAIGAASRQDGFLLSFASMKEKIALRQLPEKVPRMNNDALGALLVTLHMDAQGGLCAVKSHSRSSFEQWKVLSAVMHSVKCIL